MKAWMPKALELLKASLEPPKQELNELDWKAALSALEETFGAPSPGLSATLSHPTGESASLGRETKGEVVLPSRLRAALEFGGRLHRCHRGCHPRPREQTIYNCLTDT